MALIALTCRTSTHTNHNARYSTIRGYDPTGWMSFTCHFHPLCNRPDKAWIYSRDSGKMRYGASYTTKTGTTVKVLWNPPRPKLGPFNEKKLVK